MFEIEKRDCASRIGRLTIGDKTFKTPTLIFFKNERFPVQEEVAVIHPFLEVKNGRQLFEGKIIEDVKEIHAAKRLTGDSADRSALLVTQRDAAGFSRALYVPGTGIISDYSLLVYSGVDFIDASPLILYARNGYYLTEHGPVAEREWENDGCWCLACSALEPGFKRRWMHNYLSAIQELTVIREFIAKGRLRHLVEMRVRTDPELLAVLRHLDRRHFLFFKKRLPFVGGSVIGISEDMLRSPVMRDYRNRLQAYRKPVGSVAILLPCSAKKPYSISRSHRMFRQVIERFGGVAHELIVTSPLGVVPRELENFYPPADYDISVTGEWSNEEKEMVISMLENILSQYSTVINHTPYDFMKEYFLDMDMKYTVIDGRPTSIPSLNALENALNESSSGFLVPSIQERKTAVFRNMWEFQFGKNALPMMKEATVSGRFPFFKLLKEGVQLAISVPRSHRISLTLKGGEMIASMGINRVFIGDFIPSGDIFAVGVEDADPNIRVGDEVAVIHGEEVIAVGVSQMCSEEMREMKRGLAIKVRHRKKVS